MNSVPFWDSGDSISAACSVAITGGTFVKISGGMTNGLPTIAPCAAGDSAFGVAAYDGASGDVIMCHHSRGIVNAVLTGAAIAAGALVQADASGQAITRTTGVILGRCLDAVGSGVLAPIDSAATG